MQLGNKAAQGDLRSQRELFSLVRVSEEATNSGVSPLNPHEMDQKVMQNILRRLTPVNAEATPTNPESERKES
jgi:hypothetical protein